MSDSAILISRRLLVDLSAVTGSGLTIWQPSFRVSSSKESVLQSGLTTMNFLPSNAVVVGGDTTYPNAVFVRCPTTNAVIKNGNVTAGAPADATLAAAGWKVFNVLDTSLPIVVTTSPA